MSILKRIFREPELRESPPVLVDVGAAGGVWPGWRDIAQYSIGVGFEPDTRDVNKLSEARRIFRSWIYCEGLVAPNAMAGERKPFHLTKSPHCSSLLKPREEALREWYFADLFAIQKTISFPAVTLQGALSEKGIEYLDWLKCDTQGQDLGIFLGLPKAWRDRMLAVEFEPGLIDAYDGEEKLWHTLRAMESEPFWLCDLEVGKAPRGNEAMLREMLGNHTARWVSRLSPSAPVFANARYLRSLATAVDCLDRRALLLTWVFADLLGQHTHALMVAKEGERQFGDDLFKEMGNVSVRRLRRAMIRKLARGVWRRLVLVA